MSDPFVWNPDSRERQRLLDARRAALVALCERAKPALRAAAAGLGAAALRDGVAFVELDDGDADVRASLTTREAAARALRQPSHPAHELAGEIATAGYHGVVIVREGERYTALGMRAGGLEPWLFGALRSPLEAAGAARRAAAPADDSPPDEAA